VDFPLQKSALNYTRNLYGFYIFDCLAWNVTQIVCDDVLGPGVLTPCNWETFSGENDLFYKWRNTPSLIKGYSQHLRWSHGEKSNCPVEIRLLLVPLFQSVVRDAKENREKKNCYCFSGGFLSRHAWRTKAKEELLVVCVEINICALRLSIVKHDPLDFIFTWPFPL